ncbi:MAG: hypothetical protein HFE28_01490 [Clostridia bacterium]|jgi:hypothetical protein|nr:hypothetical protein [Clostridia bacterium]
MKKEKIIEKKLYRFIEEDVTTDSVIKEMLDFWKHYDALKRTNHYQILLMLSSPDINRFTGNGVALQLNVSDRTLLRYRKLYLESYFSFCRLNGIEPRIDPQ